MSEQEDMARLLRQWLQLTHAESEAIQAAAWPRLREIHAEKTLLRQPLDEALKKWKDGAPALSPSGDGVHPFRAEVGRLIALEAHNAQLLTVRQQKTREQLRHLERAGQNLRNLRRSYAPPPLPAWNHYS